jgi:hypothetical protein
MSVTIQAVSGAIRSTKGIQRSAKYSSSARAIRSSGVYAEKNSSNEIVIGFATNGHTAVYANEIAPSLAKVTETLNSRGFKVVEKTRTYGFTNKITSTYLVVEVA